MKSVILPLQKKLLRVLQEKSFRRVGGVVEEQSDFRLVAATNCNLVGLVEQGAFRADLQYRVQALTITLPPLRHRLEDMEVLVEHLLGRLCQRYAMAPRALSPDFLPTLCALGRTFSSDCWTSFHKSAKGRFMRMTSLENALFGSFPATLPLRWLSPAGRVFQF